MENKNTSFINKSLLYGLIAGAILIVITVIIYVLDINMLSIGFGIGIFIVNAAIIID